MKNTCKTKAIKTIYRNSLKLTLSKSLDMYQPQLIHTSSQWLILLCDLLICEGDNWATQLDTSSHSFACGEEDRSSPCMLTWCSDVVDGPCKLLKQSFQVTCGLPFSCTANSIGTCQWLVKPVQSWTIGFTKACCRHTTCDGPPVGSQVLEPPKSTAAWPALLTHAQQRLHFYFVY